MSHRHRIRHHFSESPYGFAEPESISPPLAFAILSLIQFLMFAIHYSSYSGEDKSVEFLKGPVPTDSILIYDPNRSYQLWRFVTCAFVHLSVMQLLACVGWQLVFGISLEMDYGWRKALIIYFSGVFATSLYVAILGPEIYLCGGAGGIFALIFADFMSVIINWNDFRFNKGREILPEEVLFVVTCFVYDVLLFFIFSSNISYDEDKNLVDNGFGPLLIGGFVGAMLVLILWRDQRKKQWLRVEWAILAAPFCLILTFLFILLYVGVLVAEMEKRNRGNSAGYSSSYNYNSRPYYRPYDTGYDPYARDRHYNTYRTYNTYQSTYSKPPAPPHSPSPAPSPSPSPPPARTADPYGYKRENNPYGIK